MRTPVKVKCINNDDADELILGEVYEAYHDPEFDEFYIINSQPYLTTRFELQ